jgi:hypothetical protein
LFNCRGASTFPVSVSYEDGAQDAGLVQLMLHPQHAPENVRQLTAGRLPTADRSTKVPKPDAEPRPQAFTNVIPDKYKFSAQAFGESSGYVASAKLGDTDVLHGEFLVSGSTPGQLQITIKGDSASVQGQVTSQGQPSASVIYLIPPADDLGGVKFGASGPDGHYEINGIPPGNYRIRAWTTPPSDKQMLALGGETLTLQPSEHQTVALEAAAPEQK